MITYTDILKRIDEFDPAKYGSTRNFINGSVSRLSPYISRGVISTKLVLERLINRGIHPSKMEKFIQELAWRDYFQQVWIAKGDLINQDLKNQQQGVSNYSLPCGILNASTGIEAIDNGIKELYQTGYMHNHVRMYLASAACNIAGSHWNVPARWFYYHLADADWASNALSWQWVAGAFSSKKYFANQENLNRYCGTHQRNTFLDVGYEDFPLKEIPDPLRELCEPEMKTPLPKGEEITIDPELPVILYNFYNLDPMWKKEIRANRVLLLEPYHFEAYPVSEKSVSFMLQLAANIEGIQIYTGEFSDFMQQYNPGKVFFKEHPLAKHYKGIEEPRDWMFEAKGYFPSFFCILEKVRKELYAKH